MMEKENNVSHAAGFSGKLLIALLFILSEVWK